MNKCFFPIVQTPAAVWTNQYSKHLITPYIIMTISLCPALSVVCGWVPVDTGMLLVFSRWAGCGHPPTEPSSVPSPVWHASMTSPVSGLALDSFLMSIRWVPINYYLLSHPTDRVLSNRSITWQTIQWPTVLCESICICYVATLIYSGLNRQPSVS